jgi:hypothetical protein
MYFNSVKISHHARFFFAKFCRLHNHIDRSYSCGQTDLKIRDYRETNSSSRFIYVYSAGLFIGNVLIVI